MNYAAVSIQFDERTLREFGDALEQYIGVRGDSKGWEYCINRALKDVAYLAASYTHRADYGRLKTLLSDRKTAARILAARFAAAGKRPPKQPTWNQLVTYFIGQTLRSVNFMRAGWLPAARTLDARVRESAGVSRAVAFGRSDPNIPTKNSYPQIGEAIPAFRTVGGFIGEIANQSINPRNRTSGWALAKYGGDGLDQAMVAKTADLLKYVEEASDRQATLAGL